MSVDTESVRTSTNFNRLKRRLEREVGENNQNN